MEEHWSERLRRVLRSRGWSYTELAHRSGVSREAIKKYVKGIVKKPRGRVIDRLAKALLVPTAWLRDGKPDLESDTSKEGQNKLASGIASVLFPVRDTSSHIRDMNPPPLNTSSVGSTHVQLKNYIQAVPSTPTSGYVVKNLTDEIPKYYPKRGRPRKNPHPSEFYHLSSGFQQGMHMSQQGSYSATPSSSVRATSVQEAVTMPSPIETSSPPQASAAPLTSSPNGTFDTPQQAVADRADRYVVPVYDMSTLTRPLDIGRIEPLYWQTFDARFFTASGRAMPSNFFLTVIMGDSMSPTLRYGDRVLVDRTIQTIASDGIYMLHWSGGMLIKRLSINPATHLVHIISDNTHYASYENVQPNEVHVVGRVMWVSRFL